MSRCFPYPPPGYVCNRAAGDALIKSIKIEKDKDIIKREKKEHKRRDKEQKKKERKEKKKEKERLKSSIQITDGNHKRKRVCDGFEGSFEKSSFDNSKKIKHEAEQLERSSLTEEYGQPVVTESLCYSSDGTQSHTKKCKIEQSPTNGKCTTQGKVIRFRLKKREPEKAHPADSIPSTSGRTEDSVPKVVECRPEYAIASANKKLACNLPPSVKQDTDTLLTNKLPTKKVLKPTSAYDSLFSEWVPPPIHLNALEINDDDENWLISSKKTTHQVKPNLIAYNGLLGRPSMSLQPRAHLLPEFDIYALPYTVPF